MDQKQKQKLLEELREKMGRDDTLPLRKGANRLVFGEGNPDADILFIGEGPGFWEDKKGRPFVGNAGNLLNQLLQSIKLERKDVFITNIVHFRPTNNRDPETDEINSFKPYLDGIINIINPKIIVTLGRFSMAKFIPNVKISNVHGKKHTVNWDGKTTVVIPMFHPAAGLRSTDVKDKLFEDFQKIPEVLDMLNRKERESKENVEQMQLV